MANYAQLESLLKRINQFNQDRNWVQFHNPKDLAISLSLEAGEVLEHFQWKNSEEMQQHLAKNRSKIGDELADVLYWVLLMSEYFDIDLVEALDRKMTANEAKYPTDKFKDRHNNKYDEGGKYT